nr:MAG TPA: hypothetical protein [Crassvirales sp.]
MNFYVSWMTSFFDYTIRLSKRTYPNRPLLALDHVGTHRRR